MRRRPPAPSTSSRPLGAVRPASRTSCAASTGARRRAIRARPLQVPVSGIGPHTVSCYAQNNAVDPLVRMAVDDGDWSLKIGQPTVVGIAFDEARRSALPSRRVRVRIPGHWITVRRHGKRVKIKTRAHTKVERVMRCHPRTVRRRTVVFVRVRRHGQLVKVKRVKSRARGRAAARHREDLATRRRSAAARPSTDGLAPPPGPRSPASGPRPHRAGQRQRAVHAGGRRDDGGERDAGARRSRRTRRGSSRPSTTAIRPQRARHRGRCA